MPFVLATLSFGIILFRSSIKRCNRSSLKKMPRCFSLRVACNIMSCSLYDSNSDGKQQEPQSSGTCSVHTKELHTEGVISTNNIVLRRRHN